MTPEKALADALEEKMSDEILRMIENGDPADTAKLDEIDARVWCLVNNKGFLSTHYCALEPYDTPNTKRRIGDYCYSLSTEVCPEYTRDRNALKLIRPDGWTFDIMCDTPEKYFSSSRNGKIYKKSKILPTEELAELHAIIQAIEFERARSALKGSDT